MRNFFFLVAGLISADDSRYQLQDFYCYDENGQVEVLKVVPKVIFFKEHDSFNSLSDEEQKIFFQNISGGAMIDISNFTDNILLIRYDANIVTPQMVIDFINSLPDYQIGTFKKRVGEALPIFIWREQEVIATTTIIVEARPSVSNIEALKKIISNFGKFEITDIQIIGDSPNRYRINIGHLESPSNIFVLSNLMTENKIYFKWARPEFDVLQSSISAKMFVTANGLDTLGDKRFLHLEIHIFNPKISLRKDLMPQLGEGEFIPNTARFEDVWFWADKPVVTEEIRGQEKIISFVWPFLYLNTGAFVFKDIAIAYGEEINGQITEKNGLVPGASFQIGSVIAGAQPPITDIQPIIYYHFSSDGQTISHSDGKNNLSFYWDLAILALGLTGGAVMIYFGMLAPVISRIKVLQKEKLLQTEDDQYWDALLASVDNLKIENWSKQYPLIESQLKIVLRKFFRLENAVSFENLPPSIDYRIGLILHELERVYRDENDITQKDISGLQEVVASFIHSFGHRRLSNV